MGRRVRSTRTLAALLAITAACTDGEVGAGPTATGGRGGTGGAGCPPGEIEQGGECIPAESDYPCDPGELHTDGDCRPAGVQANGCPAGQVDEGAGCRPAGLPPDQCGESDDGGCVPLLPSEPCPIGEMALPGVTVCRTVAPCGAGTWGDLVTEPNTQFVDAGYSGGNSDGTQGQPWTSISAAMSAAEPGAIVALAAGSYSGVVHVSKPLRLWGRCPSMVEIVATGDIEYALAILPGGAGSELRGLAVTGSARGFVISEATDIVATELWIHDTGLDGFDVWDGGSLTLRDSLVERAHASGGFLYAASATIERTVIRDVAPEPGSGFWGIGVLAYRADEDGVESSVTMIDSLVERTHWAGIAAVGSVADVATTAVRDISSTTEALDRGHGIEVVANAVTSQPAQLTLRSSVIERTTMDGVVFHGADGLVEASVVRDVRSTLGSDTHGVGITAVHHDEVPVGASMDVRSCVVTDTQTAGIAFFGASGTVEGTLIAEVAPTDLGDAGFGLYIANFIERGAVAVSSSRIERVHDSGLLWINVEGTVAGTVVDQVFTTADGQLYGDGIAVVRTEAGGGLALTGNVVSRAARVGVLNIGATVPLAGTRLNCSPIFLNGEERQGVPYQFINLGGNECGCDDASAVCQVVSTNVVAPEPLNPPTL